MAKNKLKEIRMREYMMEPQEFSSHIGANYKTYYSWERGIVGPSLETALMIAKKLNKKEDITQEAPTSKVWVSSQISSVKEHKDSEYNL